MSIYFFALFACLVVSMFAYQRWYECGNPIASDIHETSWINQSNKSLFIVFALFFLLTVGLRSENVGIDTINYKKTYDVIGLNGLDYLKNYKWYQEAGYAFIIILFNKLGLSWQIYAVFMGALYIVPIMILIYKRTGNAFFSLTLFIMSGAWVYPMSTMRQAAAIGITVIAFLLDNRKMAWLSCILILIASLFHISSLIAFIYLLLQKLPMRKNTVIVWLIIGAFILALGIGLLRDIFSDLMQFFGREYRNNELTGGWLQEIFFILTLILGFFFAPESDENELYWNYYKAIFLSAILLPIIRINPTLFRVYGYFSLYQIVFVPNMLSQVNDKRIKAYGYIGYFITYLYLFLTQCMVSSMKIIPYKFFWM